MIVNPGIRRFLGSAIQRLFNSASFSAPLTHSLVLERGTGSPTFTRASTATFRDWEGVLRTVPSGCARFEGARMVYNRLTKTEDLTHADWTKFEISATTGHADPEGGTTAIKLVEAAGAAVTPQIYQLGNTVAGNQFLMWIIAKKAERDFIVVNNNQGSGGGSIRCWFNLSSGTVGTVGAGGTAAITSLGDGWYLCAVKSTHANGSNSGHYFQISNADGVNTYAGDGTSGIYVWHPQLEDVTGQADQTASEYVSVGVESAPYHGAGVDGVEFFNTDRDGAVLPAATNTGYLPEDVATQLIAVTADIRDMTTANWVLGATMTRARTSVGADGVANSATRLTGGAVAATNTILYTVVAAASLRTYSALVRRVTGTGPVRIIQTGTEIDISPQLNTGGYALVQLTASVLNVAMGFKIDTNGDAIDVDFNQFESATSSSATSRIATGGGVRNKDELEYTSAGNISGTAGWAYAEITFPNSYTGASPRIIDTASVAGIPLLLASGTRNISLYDGTANREGTALPFPTSTPKRVASTWGGAVSRLALSGVTTEAAFDGAMTTTSIRIGYDHAIPGNALNGTIRNVHLGLRLLSASEMQAITAQ